MADEKGQRRRPGRLMRFVAWRAKAWADAVLRAPHAPEEEARAPGPEQPPPAEHAAPPPEAAPPEVSPPSELAPPAEAGPSGPPAHWVRDVGALRRGPPADWLARVRRGAPHLLERMGLRYGPGRFPPEVAAALASLVRPGEGEVPSEAPIPMPEPLEAGAARAEPRPFLPVQPPRQVGREAATVAIPPVPGVARAPAPPAGFPVARAPLVPPSTRAPGEAPALVARAPRMEPSPEAGAPEVETPRAAPSRVPGVARAPMPSVARAAAVQPGAPFARAPELEPPPAPEAPTGGAVLAPAPPMEVESVAYRGTQASTLEPTFPPRAFARPRTEVLRVEVPVPVPVPVPEVAALEAPVWPELPEARETESMDGPAVLREWQRLRRLEREQRGG